MYIYVAFIRWYEEQNYIEVTRKFYRNSMWFPFNIIYPWFKKTWIIDYLKSLVYEENWEYYLYLVIQILLINCLNELLWWYWAFQLMEKAKTSLGVLSEKLEDKSYFSGDSPTSLDLIVYAYLAPVLNAPLPSSQLQACLKEHDNLCKLVRRISAALFPKLKSKCETGCMSEC